MPLTSDSRPPGGDAILGEQQRLAAPSAGTLPVEVGVEGREGAATSRKRDVVVLPDGWAELCAYGLACRRW